MENFKDQIKQTRDGAEALTVTVNKLYAKLADLNKQQADMAKAGQTNSQYYQTITTLMDKYQAKIDTTTDSLTAMNVKMYDQMRVLVSSRERVDFFGKAWEGASGKIEGATKVSDYFGKVLGESANGFKTFTGNLKSAHDVISPFKDGIVKANKAYTDYAQNVASGKGKFESFKEAVSGLIKGTDESAGVFKRFKLALAQTGIGLIVMAVSALIEKLQSMKPVMDMINAVTASIGAVMSTLGNNIVGLFTNPIDTIKNFGSSMVGAAKDAYHLSLAQEKLKTALSSQEVANEKIKNQVDLLKQQAENTKLSTDVRKKKLEEAHALDEKYFNDNGALANMALNNAVKDAQIKKGLHDNEVANLRAKGTEYARTLLETGRIDQEQYEAIKKADLELIKMRKEHADGFKAFIDGKQKLSDEDAEKERTRREQQQQKAKEAADKQKQLRQQELNEIKTFIAETDRLRLDSISQMAFAKLQGYDLEVAQTQKHYADQLSRYQAYINEYTKLSEKDPKYAIRHKEQFNKANAVVKQLQAEQFDTLAAITKKFQQTDLQQLNAYQTELDDIAKKQGKTALELSIQQLQDEYKVKENTINKEHEDSEKRENILKRSKKGKNSKELESIDLQVKEELKIKSNGDAIKKQLEEKLNSDIRKLREGDAADQLSKSIQKSEESGHNTTAFKQQLQLLEMQRKAAVDSTLRTESEKLAINETFAKKKAVVEEKLLSARIHAGDKYIDAVLKNSKKDSAIYKAAFLAKKATSIADVIISTKKSVIESLKAYSGIPFIGQALGIAQAAFMAGKGAMSIAEIAKQKPGFARGGQFVSDGRGALLPGYSPTDNTNAYLRSGEAVVVSEAMRNPWARNLVSAINVAHGGRDFSMPNPGKGYAIGGIYTDGGNANRYYSQPLVDVKEMANTLAYQMINNFPPIYVDVKDVNNQQNILAQTVNRVNL